jgi:murein DD-endopeptidase MepM/ murein hydrolase activator NlpD
MRRIAPATAAVIGLAFAAPVHAAETARPKHASSEGSVTYPGTGGAVYGEPVLTPPKPKPRKKPRPRAAARPALTLFQISPRRFYPYGAAPRATFRVDGRAKQIRLRLVLTWPGTQNEQRLVELGTLTTNEAHTLDLPALIDPALPDGIIRARIAGRDDRGRILRPGAHQSRVQEIELRGHVFPLRGSFSYGGAGARFGAPRAGHTHQGQDLLAPEGTPIVAPRGGTVTYVEYQAGGAGYYVILSSDGEDLDFAFMHLKEGSTLVQKDEHVATGQQLGSVGHTGAAEGDHLHFEIWQGAWYDGGHVVDPLPYLQAWEAWSPVRAI